jgi:predicted ArsR family transcriptional regulator
MRIRNKDVRKSGNPVTHYENHAHRFNGALLMTEKRMVLELISARSKDGKASSFRALAVELGLSEEAACSHLKRLWREGLIRSDEVPPRRRLSLEPGESIRELRFQLSRRGRARLDWYAQRDEEEAEERP